MEQEDWKANKERNKGTNAVKSNQEQQIKGFTPNYRPVHVEKPKKYFASMRSSAINFLGSLLCKTLHDPLAAKEIKHVVIAFIHGKISSEKPVDI